MSKINNEFSLIIAWKFAKKTQNYNSKRILLTVGAQLALFELMINMNAGVRFPLSVILSKSGLKKIFGHNLNEKSLLFEQFSINSFQNNLIEQFLNPPLCLLRNSIPLTIIISTYFCRIDEKLFKNRENLKKKQRKIVSYSKNFRPR